jgi:1-acyl-sn-glycerol-3-phosphate acyltransferase
VAAGSDKASAPRILGAALGWARLAVRLAGFAARTAWLALAWTAGSAAARGARRGRLRERVVRSWGRAGLRALGVRLDPRGPEPPAPCLLVSNHVSYVDVFVYAALLGPSFVSMAELLRWPVVGRLARAVGTVFLDRANKRELLGVNERIRRVLAEGRRLVFFPEGTSSDGTSVRPFKPSLLEPAARAGLPVHYAAVAYRTHAPDPPASRRVAWFGGASFLPHALRLMRGGPIDASVRFGAGPLRAGDRKELAGALHAAVAGLLAAPGGRRPPVPPEPEAS